MKKVGFNSFGRRCGETHHRAKLSDIEVVQILELREAGYSFGAIAAKWDAGITISRETVRDICNGRIRNQVPVVFRVYKPGR